MPIWEDAKSSAGRYSSTSYSTDTNDYTVPQTDDDEKETDVFYFYDAQGNYTSSNGYFYDSKGYYHKFGEPFYDSRGYYCDATPGSTFYDGRDNIAQWGGAFYDGRGNYICP